jgi:hypothetical protein
MKRFYKTMLLLVVGVNIFTYETANTMVQSTIRAERTEPREVAGRTDLHNAVISGDYGTLIIAQRQNLQDSEGKSPLHLAAECGNVTAVGLLIGAGGWLIINNCVHI